MACLLGLVILISALSTSVESGSAYECSSSLDCSENDIGTKESPEECCVDNPQALSYQGIEECVQCVVYGFFEDSYTGVEQGPVQGVAVGYLKGAGSDNGQTNLNFNVMAIQGTAREGPNLDFTLSTPDVTVMYTAEEPEMVQFLFRVDSISQEPNETLSLQLVQDATQLSEGVFFRDTIEMTIFDSDVLDIFFLEDDFLGRESDTTPQVPVVLTKSLRIATPVTVEVVPLTQEDANLPQQQAEMINVPQDNPFSPPYASQPDFNNTVITVIFEPDEDVADNVQSVPIPIVDDLINEATEQVFIARLNLVDSLIPNLIDLTDRNATLCRIRDNDAITIGFELPRYSYTEPMFDETIDDFYLPPPGSNDSDAIFLAKENDVVSEQTFVVIFQVQSTVPEGSTSIRAATLGDDYSVPGEVYDFPSRQQRLVFPFELFRDDIAEGTESFQVAFFPGNSDTRGTSFFVPSFSNTPMTLNANTFAIINDDDIVIIGFEVTEYSINEAAGSIEVFVSVLTQSDVTLPTSIPVVVRTVNGSAVGGEDYEELSERDVLLTFDDTTRRLSFNVTIFEDGFIESLESFDLQLSFDPELNVVPSGVVLNPDKSTITITDEDKIIIGFEQTEYNVHENVGTLEVYVRVFNPPDNLIFPSPSVNVLVQTRSQSAVAGEDFEEIDASSFDVSLVFEETIRRLAFNVTIFDDDQSETEEEFDLLLLLDSQELTEAIELVPSAATVTIADNNGQTLDLTVSFDKESYTVSESEEYVEVCFSTNMGHDQEVEVIIVPVETPDVSNPAYSISDFLPDPVTQTFEESDSSNTLCANITISPDMVYEHAEEFSVIFENLPNAEAGVFVGQINQTRIIIEDDDKPVFRIGPNTVVNESTPTVEVCISTNSSLEVNVVVTVVTETKSGVINQATENLDYIPKAINLTFVPNDEDIQELCTSVEIINDLLGNEPDELFSVKLVDVLIEGSDEACITIIDDDIPEVDWEISEITIEEGRTREVCFNTDIGTATPYEVAIGAREKGSNPATSGDYDIQQVDRVITIPVSLSEGRFCIDVSIISDTDQEGDEQFELYFENLPSMFANVGENDTVCVTISDAGTPPPTPDVVTCLFMEPLRVKPFSRTSMYGFMGTCEHIAVSSCESIPGFDVQVTVDFLTGSDKNGAVGLHINDLRYVSREDGTFDDGDQPLTSSSPNERQYLFSFSRVVVNFGEEMTNITFEITDPEQTDHDIELHIVHFYGGDNPFIQINARSPNDSLLENCGLCGSRSGQLLKRDGTVISMTEAQQFANCYLVEPRDQILRPQRKECGSIRNDTVIGDPLYAAPLYSEDGKEYSLCYEVLGSPNTTLNLVSDTCVSVNARYSPMDDPELGNIISSVGVRAKGDGDNSCHNIRVDLDGCSATIDSPGGISSSLSNLESFQQDGISVRKYPRRVRIAAPNCENVMLVMWVICENENNQDMIKFVIARGVNLRASSHGLLGQFWNIPVTFTNYTGNDLPSDYDPEDFYVVTVMPESSSPRSFLGEFYHLKWDTSREPCLYAGNAQGGPGYEVEDPNDSIIEGDYSDYIIPSGDLFETEFKYVQFDEERCGQSTIIIIED